MGGMHIEERREWAPTEKRADSSNSILITLCALVFTNLSKVSSCKSSEMLFFFFFLSPWKLYFFNKKGDERLAYAPVNPQSEIISFKYLFNFQNKYQSSDFADSFFARISRNSPLYLFRLLWGLLLPSYIHLCSLVNILTCQRSLPLS